MIMLDRKTIVRKTFEEMKNDTNFVPGSMAERLSMVWDLTRDAWAFVRDGNAERRLQRHVVVLVRRKS